MNDIPKRPGEIAKTLNVTTATLRNYAKKFAPFLSKDATGETNRRYTPEDVETLKLASSLLRDGLTYEQVRSQLQERPVTGEVIEDETTGPEPPEDTPPEDTEPEPAVSMQTLEFFEKFVQPALSAKDETIEILQRDKERLLRENAWLRLPWYRRLFTKPPDE